MRLPEGLNRLAKRPSSLPGGVRPPLPPSAAALVVPVALVVTAIVVQRRRNNTAAVSPASVNGASPAGITAAKVPAKPRRKPRNRVRYYALGLVINALERESTRKALLAVLKAAQNRA